MIQQICATTFQKYWMRDGIDLYLWYQEVLTFIDSCLFTSTLNDNWYKDCFLKVYLENCVSEVFIHLSAVKCWDMVRERINQEILKQNKLARLKLPPLQPPGSLDGMKMFGFSSPSILQVILKVRFLDWKKMKGTIVFYY